MSLCKTYFPTALVAAVVLIALPAQAELYEVEAKCKGDSAWDVTVQLTLDGAAVGPAGVLLCDPNVDREVETSIDTGVGVIANDVSVMATAAAAGHACTFTVPPGEPLEEVETRCEVRADGFRERISIEVELEEEDDDDDDDD